MDKLYIVAPAYNEEENIEEFVNDWYPVVENINKECRLLIVDDGSKDNTYQKLEKLQETRPQLIAETKANSGHGPTCLWAYRYALKEGADYVFQTDSDGQTLPIEFQQFWNCREANDLVIGHRKGRQDGASRVFVTKTLRTVVWACLGVRVKDANTPFRLMKAEFLKEAMTVMPEDFFLANVIISAVAVKRNKKIQWFTVTFRPRQGGVNSINFKRIVGIGKEAVGSFRSIRKQL